VFEERKGGFMPNNDRYENKTGVAGTAEYGGGSAYTEQDYSGFIGYEVVDRNSNKVGTVQCFWTDHTGQAAFVGVETGWFMPKIHVIPVHQAEVSERRRRLRIPYTEEKVRSAPSHESEEELRDEHQISILRHYGIESGIGNTQATQPGETEGIAATTVAGSSEERVIPLSEEEISVQKRETGGGVRLKKVVRTEVVNQPVELEREDIVVERVPASETGAADNPDFSEEEIFVPLRREEAVVSKESHVREGVRVGKTVERERRDVSETVRKEDIEVERSNQRKR
jgi:uncharacterized protein (TIGR02271 family)